ncbi:MAG: flippase-like domain-containing protein [candidate division Zixibacteria bacterium]|nr:flippase-like domain-containing protein [candidate division Zixibacteria bacterium]
MGKKLLIVFGILVAAFFLYLFVQKIEWVKVVAAIRQANYWWLLPNIVMIFASMALRAWRWGVMVNPLKRCSFRGLYAATMIGFMASNILPARLGELARPLSLGKIEDVSRSAAMATTLVERVFDLLTLLALFTVIILFKEFPASVAEDLRHLEAAGWAFLAVTLVAVFVLTMLKLRTDFTLRILNKPLKIFPPRIQEVGSDILAKFASGLQVLSDPKSVAIISAQSALLWVIMALSNYFIFLAFDMSYLPIDASFVVLAVVSVGIMLPNAPGFIGPYQYLTVLSLSLYNVPADNAAACSIVMWATQYFTITLAGLYHLKKEHLSLREVENQPVTD